MIAVSRYGSIACRSGPLLSTRLPEIITNSKQDRTQCRVTRAVEAHSTFVQKRLEPCVCHAIQQVVLVQVVRVKSGKRNRQFLPGGQAQVRFVDNRYEGSGRLGPRTSLC